MTQPKTLEEALENLGNSNTAEQTKWQLLAIILREFALAKGVSLDEVIEYPNES